jgi:hypothetical protein
VQTDYFDTLYFMGLFKDLLPNKIFIFWDITSCSPAEVNRLLGGTHHLHLQGRSASQSRNQLKLNLPPATAAFLLGLPFYPEDGDDVPPKRRLTHTALDGVLSQKVRHFVAIAVRAWNPTLFN